MEIKTLTSGSTGNAYYVTDGVSSVLLDAGLPVRLFQIDLGYKLSQISGVLITHHHGDHVKAAADLARLGIDVYISKGEAEAAKLSGHRIKHVKALQTFKCGGFWITPFDLQHDTPEPLGFLIASETTGEKLLYFTDTFYLKYTFKGITHILGECNHSREIIERNVMNGDLAPELAARIIKSHMCLERFEDFLKESDLSKLQSIHLVHVSEGNGDPVLFAERISALTTANVRVELGGS